MLTKLAAYWAAVGVTLTGATQLRMAGLPLGPGEVLLMLWMGYVLIYLLGGLRFSCSDAFQPFLLYWAISTVLLAAGSIAAIRLGLLETQTAKHDALAFAFAASLTCLLAVRLGGAPDEYYMRLARATFFAISGTSLILFGASLATSQLGPISLWYYDVRFRGWSENPNQLANFLLPMPFLGWYLLQRTSGLGRKLAYAIAIVVCVLVGWATGSDSMRVAWAGGLAAIGAWLWFRLVIRGRGKFVYISHCLVPMVAIALTIGAGTEIAEQVQDVLRELYQKQGQGDTRITVWSHGIEAILHSPLVGLGPGAHSGFTGPLEGLEAHNTFIDWASSAGLLGALLLLLLCLWCTWRTLHANTPALLGVALAVMIDSLFGYSLRQPVYWLLLVLVVALTEHRAVARLPTAASKSMENESAALAERTSQRRSVRRKLESKLDPSSGAPSHTAPVKN